MSDEEMARRLREGLDNPVPRIVVDPGAVVRKGRRRRTARVAAVSSTAVALVAGVTVAAVAVGSSQPRPASTPTVSAVAQAGPTTIYANDRQYAEDGTVVSPGTLLATLASGADGAEGCEAADAVVAGSGYFCDWVTKILVTDPAFGATEADRRALLDRGGLTITTTLDPGVQTTATEEVLRSVPVGDPSGVVQAMAVVEPGTGQVKALAQSTTYTATDSEALGETTINLNVAQPYDNTMGFQPGSAFQVFTLLAWLEAGHSLDEVVSGSSPQTFQMSQFTGCNGTLGGNAYTVNSSEGGAGSMTVADATKNSVNVAFMSMATQLSLCTIMQRAADLGVVQAGSATEPFHDYPSNVFGTDSTTPLAMAGAFAAFASGGIYCTPIAITKVVDTSGENLPVPDAGCHQEIDPGVAAAMNLALSGVWSGTMTAVPTPAFPSAGATGTTNHNEYTWFVGYTPRLSAAVVVSGSLSKYTSPNNKTIGGTRYGTVFGATIAGPTWQRFVTRALDDGQPNPDFSQGPSELVNGAQVSIPDVTGMSVDEATTTLQSAGFTVSVAPDQVASSVAAGLVAQQSPTGTTTPGSAITLSVSNG